MIIVLEYFHFLLLCTSTLQYNSATLHIHINNTKNLKSQVYSSSSKYS